MNHSLVDGGGVADFSIMTRNQMIEVLIEDIRRDAENMHSNGELIDHYTRVAIRSVVSGDSSDEDVEQALIDRGLGHEPPVTYSFSVGDRVFWKDPCEGLSSGWYTVISLNVSEEFPMSKDTIIDIKNDLGGIAEVTPCELSK